MIITRIETLDKGKVKVTIDDGEVLVLDQREAEQFDLIEGKVINNSVYEKILEGRYHKAIQKALSILTFRDRSEQELRSKLSQAYYPDMIIDRVLDYVRKYGYFNEERFTAAYIRARKNRKSRLVIKNELLQKGVAEDMIEEAFAEEYDENSEEDAELNIIKKEIAKRAKDPDALTYEQKQKIIASLYRKGFDIGKIKQLL